MSAQYSIIRNKFGIDWSMVKWSDLRKPLYSGIAAALYTILKGGVGWRVEDQAQFWQNYYHSYGGNNFTNLANILDLGIYLTVVGFLFIHIHCILKIGEFSRSIHSHVNLREWQNAKIKL